MSRLLIPRFPTRLIRLAPPARALRPAFLHSSAPAAATALPITAHGPPPKPPLPAGEIAELRRRQKIESVQDLAAQGKAGRGRFWKEVRVVDVDGGLGIELDARPVKTPSGRPLVVPRTKPLLAAAIAVEWSHLRTSADAHKGYLVPLTQLASRALDLTSTGRAEIVDNLLRYLDTDTLLCLAPTTPAEPGRVSLRELQEEEAAPVVAFLTTRVWPGVVLIPVDGDRGMAVEAQPEETRSMVRAWVAGLGVWDLVGLERAVLATKSLLVAARLVAEWSEEMDVSGRGRRAFGIGEAAWAASVEVRFQTGRWGEVEDTHDVEKEDSRRQLGATLLLVAGSK